MILFKHQQDLIDKNPNKCLIAFDVGTGKTLTALMLAKKNNIIPLIICPKKIKGNWQEQVNEHLNGFGLILTKEEFKKQYLELQAYKAVIFDEAHYLGNLKSQLSKAFRKYTTEYGVNYVWLLTATPYLSTPMNIYALGTHLGHKWNYWTFFHRFFYQKRLGNKMIPAIKDNIEDEIAELVRKIGVTAKLEDLIDVPEQTFETQYLDLTKEQDKAIENVDEEYYITRWTKVHQIENGVFYGGEYNDDKYFECYKTDIIKDMVVENKKIAIFCRYNKQIDYLREQLEDCGKPVYIINGKTSEVNEAESASECVVLINSSCSEGYELPSINVIVFASLSFSYKDYYQSCGRFLRINKPSKNYYLHLVTKGVDKDIYNCIMKKQDFNFAIYERSQDDHTIQEVGQASPEQDLFC